MKKTILYRLTKVIAVTGYFLLITFPLVVSAAVTLKWDANNLSPEGYNIYQREAGQSYDDLTPINDELITDTQFSVNNLQPGTTYFFVVRAYSDGVESLNSNEEQYAEPASLANDRDGDGVVDVADAFPDNPSEWVDTDNDGTGNNSDPDDDGDGMSDSYESQFEGLDPLVDDANGDLDGDGISNINEHDNGTDPSIPMPPNTMPITPVLSAPAQGATVSLTPTLTTEAFSDANGDSHLQTRYQIALDDGFSDLVFDRVYSEFLTDLPLMDLILDPETSYYWRAMFIDDRGGASLWSAASFFATEDYRSAGDIDADGILDSQEVVDLTIDLDGNQMPDATQNNLKCVVTGDGINPYVSIEGNGSEFEVVGLRALLSDDVARAFSLNQPETLTGLISFKVFLDDGVTSASLTIYFSAEAPEGAAYYYKTEDGWVPYSDAIFSLDRKSVTITLEDGGDGDQDGVENGIIVDPAGLGYSSQTNDSGSFGTTSESTCFIATPLAENMGTGLYGWMAMLSGLIIGGGILMERRQKP